MELFSNYIKFDEDNLANLETGVSPRASFDSFLKGFTTIFIVIIGDDWNVIMYDHIRATNYSAAAFFISLVIIGNWILLNLFQAILLKNFEED